MASSNKSPSERIAASLEYTDDLGPELRLCVQEFGYAIVRAFINNGITKPNKIRQLVHECWKGPRNPRQAGKRHAGTSVLNELDWLLINAGSPLTAETILRVFWQNSFVLMPYTPTKAMVDASIATVRNHTEVMTKTEKHSRRLDAAIKANVQSMWPHLVEERAA